MLCEPFGYGALTVPHAIVSTLWAIGAAFMGLKGIQYVARVATYFPLIPLTVLVVLFLASARGLTSFSPTKVTEAGAANREVKTTEIKQERVPGAEALRQTGDIQGGAEYVYPVHWVEIERVQKLAPQKALPIWGVLALVSTYIVGFFATAGAAGADFGMNSRDSKDVQMGGLVGIAGATIFAGGMALLIVAGSLGLAAADPKADLAVLRATPLMDSLVGPQVSKVFMYLLALAAFPPACFSAFIAANSFKTTLPKVNPFISVGIGTAVAALLAVSGMAGNVIGMFMLIGASFGPVCGAMTVDYILSGQKWAGPRAGFNPAGWISWAVGFAVGAADFIPGMKGYIVCPPVAAFVVGAALYYVLAKLGLESRVLEMPKQEEPQTTTT